jgi:hypothetical protein
MRWPWRVHHRKSMRVDFIQSHFWSGQVSSRERSSIPCRVLCPCAVRAALRKLLQLWLRDSPISSPFPPLLLINQSISHINRTPSSSGSHDHFKLLHFLTRPESNFYSSKIGCRCFHWDKFVRDWGFRRLAGCPDLHSFDSGESFFRSVVDGSAFWNDVFWEFDKHFCGALFLDFLSMLSSPLAVTLNL